MMHCSVFLCIHVWNWHRGDMERITPSAGSEGGLAGQRDYPWHPVEIVHYHQQHALQARGHISSVNKASGTISE